MLVLSRKRSERIFIGDNIILTVIKTGKGRVRLGIKAPRQIRILREELLKPDKQETDITDLIVTEGNQ